MPLVVISGPSGAGKTSIADKICNTLGWSRVISYTTRNPRLGETNGRDYNFIGLDQFDLMRDAGHFLEHAEVLGNYYGTPRVNPAEKLVFVIDPQGALSLALFYPNILKLFITAPSKEHVFKRLHARNDSAAVIKERMQAFEKTIQHASEYDFIITNDCLSSAIEEVGSRMLEFETKWRTDCQLV